MRVLWYEGIITEDKPFIAPPEDIRKQVVDILAEEKMEEDQ